MDTTLRDPLIGHVLDGRYRVESRVAVGGMATVYRAVDTRLDRVLALKVMSPALVGDSEYVARFIREAKSVARLSHSNVVGVFDQGRDGDHVFLAMEYIEGCTLRDILRTRGALSPRTALDILEPVVAALGAAHRAGLVHRDVKPENVLIADDGRVKVADFGLVRAVSNSTSATAAGTVLGTVAYLAPEQIEHGTSDCRSDVFACGLLLYELLTGALPQTGGTPGQAMFKRMNEPIPPASALLPGLAPQLDALIAAATAREPGHRPADAVALLAAVQQVRRGLTPAQLDLAPPGTPPEPDGDATALPAAPSPASPHPPMPSAPPLAPQGAFGADGDATAVLPAVGPAGGGDGMSGPQQFGSGPQQFGAAQQFGPPQFGPRTSPLPPAAGAQQSGVQHLPQHQGGTQHTRVQQLPDDLVMPQSRPVNETRGGSGDAGGSGGTGGGGRSRRRGWRPPHPVRATAIITVLVLLIGGLSWWALEGRYTTVPRVLGTNEIAAVKKLGDAGLGHSVGRAFSESIAKGDVISLDPSGGSQIERGGKVRLTVSKGPRRMTVPDLKGKTLAETRRLLKERKLLVGQRSSAFSESVKSGRVISSEPGKGTELKSGTSVDLVLSKGATPIEIPDVADSSVADATEELEGTGFKVKSATKGEFSADVEKGDVIRTDPTGTAPKGDRIRLVVSKGPKMISVPDVVGEDVDDARDTLEGKGFEVNEDNGFLGLGGGDTVKSQTPAAGEEAAEGSEVTIETE